MDSVVKFHDMLWFTDQKYHNGTCCNSKGKELVEVKLVRKGSLWGPCTKCKW